MAEERVNYSDVEESVKKLKDIAEELEETNTKIKDTLNLDGVWEGDAADAYKEAVTNFLNQGQYLSEAPGTIASAGLFLMSAAGAYEETESEIGKALKKLLGGQEEIDKMDVSSLPDVDLESRVSDKYKEQKQKDDEDDDGNGNSSKSSGGYPSSGGGYSSGGGGYSSGGGGYSGGGGVAGGVTATTKAISKESEDKNEKEKDKDKDKDKEEEKEIPSYLTKTYEEESDEKAIEKVWKDQGSKYKDDIATLEVEEEDRYLVCVSENYGKIGDAIDITLDDNTTIKCIVAETAPKVTDDASTQQDVLEFKINPEAKDIKYSWSADNKVTKITNKGSIMNSVQQSREANNTVPVDTTNSNTTDVTASDVADAGTTSNTTETISTTIEEVNADSTNTIPDQIGSETIETDLETVQASTTESSIE